MRFYLIIFVFVLNFLSAQNAQPYVLVLGVAQDGGYPHLGCEKECCKTAWKNDSLKKNVVSLALVSPTDKKWWLFEATPDITKQLQLFKELTNSEFSYLPSGIFLTHAHIGHYTGLMNLGREVFNTSEIPVYCLPKMKSFLETNGPWSQLVKLKNIVINEISTSNVLALSKSVSVNTFTVPHRDEYSETAGFKISTETKSYLFIPDIDKWQKWSKNIIEEVKQSNFALLDATFYSIDELKGRKIEEVPHPLVSETMDLFKSESADVKSKIVFIHFNHTNPCLRLPSFQNNVKQSGFKLAEQGKTY